MVFELRPGNDLAEDIRRLGYAQLGHALAHLSGFPARQKGVHDARKCLKRARSLLHIARPAISPSLAKKLDRRTAEIAGALSGTRDAQAMIEALDSLEEHFGPDWSPQVRGGLRALFQRRGGAPSGDAEKTLRQLDRLRKRFAGVELERGANPGPGIERTYARARERFKEACELGDGTAFHDWRKEAQRHWRQMQLMVAAWPEAMAVRIDRARALSQCLGDDHDLYILLGYLRAAGPELAPWPELERFYDGCIERQLAMRMAARNHGRLLFAERPDAFAKRLMAYWRAAADRYSQGMPFAAVATEMVVDFPAAAVPSAAVADTPASLESEAQNAAE